LCYLFFSIIKWPNTSGIQERKILNSKQNFSKSNNFSLSNNILLFKGKIYVPSNWQSSFLNIFRESPSADHFGFNKTFSLINRNFWWSSLQRDIKDNIRSCEIYCRSKDSRHKLYGLLNPIEIPDRHWT